MTAIRTTPPARTTCTTDIGAIASAATWKPQALVATTMPSANHFDENSDFAVRSGGRMSTGGASQAPRCLKKNPRFETTAHSSASMMPSWIVIDKLESPGHQHRGAGGPCVAPTIGTTLHPLDPGSLSAAA